MKKLKLLMVVIFMSGVTTSFAQKNDQKEWDAKAMSEKHMEKISEVLPGLSDDQKSKLIDADQAQFEKRKAFHDENKENREAMREKMQEFREAKLATYKEVLSQEQYVTLLEWMVTHPRHGEGHRGDDRHKRHHKPESKDN